eukprot:gene9085-6378_t
MMNYYRSQHIADRRHLRAFGDDSLGSWLGSFRGLKGPGFIMRLIDNQLAAIKVIFFRGEDLHPYLLSCYLRSSAMAEVRTQFAHLLFYVRERYWHHAEELCTSVINATDDWLFRVWRGVCLDQQGLVNEAIREYKAAEPKRQTFIPALMGQLIVYKRNHDEKGVDQTEMKLGDTRYENDISSWVQAAAMLWASGDLNGARDILLRFQDPSALEHSDEYTNFATVRSWVDFLSGRSAWLEKCGSLFQKVLDMETTGKMDANAALGRVAYYERKYNFAPAQELLNKVIVSYPSFTPALVVKARLLMSAEDWDQALETTHRILSRDKNNVEAVALEALHALIKDSHYTVAANHLKTLYSAVEMKEPRNAPLIFSFARAFSRLSADNLQLLNATSKFAEQACLLDPKTGNYVCEVGYQQMYRGDFKNAINTFKKAAGMTDSLAPLIGTAACEIHLGHLDSAAKQIEYCNQLQPVSERNAELSFLNAMIEWRLRKDQKKALIALDDAANAIRQDISTPNGNDLDLYVKLNVPLMIAVAKEYMQHGRNEPPDLAFRREDPISEKCGAHLELLTRHVPGCTAAQLLLSQLQFVSGNLVKAQTLIKACLRHEHPLPEAYLLSAQICQYIGDVKVANLALEQALTLDFEVKDQPYYNLLHGIILSMTNRPQQALEAFQLAMKIVNNPQRVTEKGRPIQPLTVNEHVTLYLQIAQVHLKLRDTDEARKALSEAAVLFRDTAQSARVTIAQAMLLARTDVDKSIEMLRDVSHESDHYIAARSQMAKLYLTQRQNYVKYAECYEEMTRELPTAQSFVQLAEAYTTIQEPEKAIAAYEKAKALAPKNSDLLVRIGRAMVATHKYQQAVKYYTDALRGDENLFNVRADLAMLLWRLDDVEKALEFLYQAPIYTKEPDADEDLKTAIERVNCVLIIYKILRGQNRSKEAIDALQQARAYQFHVLESKIRNESRETMLQQKSIMATISTEMGKFFAEENDQTKAKECFTEALKFDDSHEQAMICMARLLLSSEEVELCEQQCAAILKMNPSCEEAVIILADLMIRKDRSDEAAQHFEQLLEKKHNNYEALVQYIILLHRAGRVTDAKPWLERASGKLALGHHPDPGLSYAHGLYEFYNNANVAALKHFNSARVPSDNPWSAKAIKKMIEIYLVPTAEDIWIDSWVLDDKSDNRQSAESLLLQLPIGDTRKLLHAYCLMASKQRPEIEKAVKICLEIIHHSQDHAEDDGSQQEQKKLVSNEEMDEDDALLNAVEIVDPGQATLASALEVKHVNVPAFLALSIALYLNKQETIARKVLQRIFSTSRDPKHAESLERALLLSAHMDVKAKNFDAACETLRKVIDSNKGCGSAWDSLGMIYERQQNHKEASACYQSAWKLVNESDPGIGYKLAFNYLKGADYVKAIDICRSVLAKHATYPRIEEDIMDVAYSLLRP